MNKKIFPACFAYLFMGMLLLSSCQADEEVDNPRNYFSRWGYFKGNVKGKSISLANDIYQSHINKVVYCKGYTGGTTVDCVKGCVINIGYAAEANGRKTEVITIMLAKPNIGVRQITNGWPFIKYANYDTMCNVDAIEIRASTDKTHLYTPHQDEPFKVEITEMTYQEDGHPYIIEGKLDGKLYDTKSGEIIEIHGEFGTK
ncbi:DUF5025 domain-containing protein [Bacteroides sp. KH569_7]|uniref:DUF5025 domain-containing protein n=1 Tax=Bacteroides muris (ex Fokt et al. 2023) TaxID=2937417 RepID=A0A9X2NR67_9BACE|nr:DUF5025 domain-containing protein [Bacteroides muris (ex Fokt et al. 2023)]MCR6504395.1 DUF5025 domain-containing protein [Bacteroides muris (ex Fokt et al. 2023)]MCR6509786.1 DUF5025 domain-containing protein [Bacteroides muris (ex Fokt et al. 2023)]